ncbi:hypothetical protein TWF694_000112 [Orbilia ellipsospora]|uniref:Uncharacterized protein n=1 Tax=Orbilia ellipsospora TaxID=2528407 RepID=A0AAV9XUC3_9PEZI
MKLHAAPPKEKFLQSLKQVSVYRLHRMRIFSFGTTPYVVGTIPYIEPVDLNKAMRCEYGVSSFVMVYQNCYIHIFGACMFFHRFLYSAPQHFQQLSGPKMERQG